MTDDDLPEGLNAAGDSRWLTAEFGARLQEYVDQLTPDGYPRQIVDTWLMVAETVIDGGQRQITIQPSDRFQIPKLLGMCTVADTLLRQNGIGIYGSNTE